MLPSLVGQNVDSIGGISVYVKESSCKYVKAYELPLVLFNVFDADGKAADGKALVQTIIWGVYILPWKKFI